MKHRPILFTVLLLCFSVSAGYIWSTSNQPSPVPELIPQNQQRARESVPKTPPTLSLVKQNSSPEEDTEYAQLLLAQAHTLLDQALYQKALRTLEKASTYDTQNADITTYLEVSMAGVLSHEYFITTGVYPETKADIPFPKDVEQHAEYEYFSGERGICMSIPHKDGYHVIGKACSDDVLTGVSPKKTHAFIHEQSLYSTDPREFGKWGFGYFKNQKEGYYIINDTVHGPFDDIDSKSPYFSEERTAYLSKTNDTWTLTVDDTDVVSLEALEVFFHFSDDGWVLRYRDVHDKFYVRTNTGKTFGPYIYADTVHVSGGNWAFRQCNFNIAQDYAEVVINRSASFQTRCGMVMNTGALGPYDLVEHPRLSEDDVSFVFTRDGKDYVWGNGTESSAFDPQQQVQSWYEKGNHIQEYREESGYFLQINTDRIGPLDVPSGGGLQFSDMHWGFRYKDENNRRFVVINSKTSGPYASASIPVIHTNSWGFTFSDASGKYFVNISGQIYGPYATAGRLLLSDFGFSFQYETIDGQDALMVNDTVIGPYPLMKAVKFFGEHWGFEYQDTTEKHFLFVDGTRYGPYPNGSPFLSPYDPLQTSFYFTEDAWVYHTTDTQKREYVIVNGESFGPYSHGGSDGFVHPTQLEIWEGNWGLWYEDSEKNNYQVVNGVEYGPFKKAYDGGFQFGVFTWGLRFRDFHDRSFVLIGGEQYGPFDSANQPVFGRKKYSNI